MNFIFNIKKVYKSIMESLKNWMVETANIMFDDSKNDLRSLPKTLGLQILIVLSFLYGQLFLVYICF